MIKLNTEVTPNVREFHTVGILKKLGTEYRANKKGTNYTLSEVEITYPDGRKVIVDATTYENSLKVNKDRFTVGAVVGIVAQMEGDYAGNVKLRLPMARQLDLSKYSFEIQPLISKEESIIKDNVIDKELVT